MKILLAKPRGFCAGVHMAVDTVQELVELIGPPLYVFHEIVHNKHVVERFVRQGVVFVDALAEVPVGGTVVFSAHGVSPAVRKLAEDRKLRMIDATCPLVTKVHIEARRYAKQGCRILLVGHKGHDEIEGTFGEAPQAITIVESAADVDHLEFPPDQPLVYLTQTTLSTDDAKVIIDAILRKFPRCAAPPKEDICYATTNRQHAVRQLAPRADVTLVIGSKNSSNSVRLTEISQNVGTRAFLLDDASEFDPAWVDRANTVLLTAGASAPEDLVEAMIARLRRDHGAEVEEVDLVPEDMQFAMPVQLRVLRSEIRGKAQA